MQDVKTRRLLFLIFIPPILLSSINGMHVSDFAKGLANGLLIAIQLLSVLKLKQHRTVKKLLNS